MLVDRRVVSSWQSARWWGTAAEFTDVQRRHRLRDSKRFQAVRRHGRSWAHPIVVLCALPNDLEYSRIGFTAGKRIGNAVQRNWAKRRMREAVRMQMAEVMDGWDMVFIARSPLRRANFAQIQRACLVLLKRAKLYRPPAKGFAKQVEGIHTVSDSRLPEGDFPPIVT